jgi:hypothetical protein
MIFGPAAGHEGEAMLRPRVFICFASEHRTLAEAIALRLKGDGFSVFVDRLSLGKGEEYDRRIREELSRCDLLIFLISPESIEPGSYCRTELALAESRWPHPHDKVLPVRLAPVPAGELPPYLQAVTYLDPPGNVPADVAHAVDAWRKRRRRRYAVVAGVAAFLVGAAIVIPQLIPPAAVALRVDPLRVFRHRASVGDAGDQFRVELALENDSSESVTLDQVELEVKQPELTVVPSFTLDAELPVLVGPESHRNWSFAVAFHRRLDFKPLSEAALPGIDWRVCWEATGKRACSSWGTWSPAGEPPREKIRRLPGELGGRARWVTQAGAAFVAALTNPHQLLRLDEQGRPVGEAVDLPGYPVALVGTGEQVFVATRGTNAVEAFEAKSLTRSWSRAITAPAADLSTEPKSMAVLRGEVWMVTTERMGEARLWRLPAPDAAWQIVPYSDEFGFKAEVLQLHVVQGELWAVEELSPVSIRRLGDTGSEEFSGHAHPIISCADGVVAGRDKGIALLSCDNDLAEVKPLAAGRLQLLSAIPTSLASEIGPTRWTESLLLQTEEGVLLALSTLEDQPNLRPFHARIARMRWGSPAEMLVDEPNMVVTSFAARNGRALAVVQESSGERYGLLAFEY